MPMNTIGIYVLSPTKHNVDNSVTAKWHKPVDSTAGLAWDVVLLQDLPSKP